MCPFHERNGVNSDMVSSGPQQSKRPSRSLRTVAELDPIKLEHKRTIDRNAQRSFRERTKAQIKKLEDQVAALSSPQPEAIASITKERDDLKSTNEKLRGRIKDIENVLKTILRSGAKDVYEHASESAPQAISGGENDTAAQSPASSLRKNPPACTTLDACTTHSGNWQPEDLFTSRTMNTVCRPSGPFRCTLSVLILVTDGCIFFDEPSKAVSTW